MLDERNEREELNLDMAFAPRTQPLFALLHRLLARLFGPIERGKYRV